MKKEIETEIDGRVYETSMLIVDTMSESEALEKYNAIKQSIAGHGVSFISEELPYMRELSYEMTRVIKNQNVRFDNAYFAWVKYSVTDDNENYTEVTKAVKKLLDNDEDIIRYMTVKTVAENTTYTKPNPVVKAESLSENLIAGSEEVIAEAEAKDDTLANPLD